MVQLWAGMVQTAVIEPLHDRVLVKRIPEPYAGRIKLICSDKSRFAKVLAVGPGKWIDGVFTKTCVQRGDVVLVPGVASKYPDWEEHDEILIQEGDIGAIVG